MAKTIKSKRFSADDPKNEISVGVSLIEKLSDAREASGYTQERLAELVGMKQSAIARLENKSSMPRIDTMIKLLEPLGYTLAVVPEGTPDVVIETKAKAKAAKKAKPKKQKEPKETERKVIRQKGTPPLKRQSDDYSQGPTHLINVSGDMFD